MRRFLSNYFDLLFFKLLRLIIIITIKNKQCKAQLDPRLSALQGAAIWRIMPRRKCMHPDHSIFMTIFTSANAIKSVFLSFYLSVSRITATVVN